MTRFALAAIASLLLFASSSQAALVTSNLIQFLDADRNVATTGSSVNSWAPVAGVGDSVTTSVGSPQLNVAALNGRDTITFTADRMNGTDLSLFDFGTGGITWFAVARPAASAANTNIFGTLENGEGFDGLQLEAKAGNEWHADFRSSGPNDGVTEAASSLGEWRIFTGTRDGDTVELLVDGVSQGTLGGFAGASIPGDALAVGAERTGGSEFANFDIAALLIYDTLLTDALLNETGVFLESRFGLQTAFIALPEPSTALLLTCGLLGLVTRRRRK